MKPGGVAIINNQALPPLSVNLGNERYPDDKEIIGIIRQQTENLYIVNGTSEASELGNVKTLNILMLGCLLQFTPFSEDVWQDCITQNLPSGVIDINLSAFKIGMREIEDMINEKRGTRDA